MKTKNFDLNKMEVLPLSSTEESSVDGGGWGNFFDKVLTLTPGPVGDSYRGYKAARAFVEWQRQGERNRMCAEYKRVGMECIP
jgi:hypothetical protein